MGWSFKPLPQVARRKNERWLLLACSCSIAWGTSFFDGSVGGVVGVSSFFPTFLGTNRTQHVWEFIHYSKSTSPKRIRSKDLMEHVKQRAFLKDETKWASKLSLWVDDYVPFHIPAGVSFQRTRWMVEPFSPLILGVCSKNMELEKKIAVFLICLRWLFIFTMGNHHQTTICVLLFPITLSKSKFWKAKSSSKPPWLWVCSLMLFFSRC